MPCAHCGPTRDAPSGPSRRRPSHTGRHAMRKSIVGALALVALLGALALTAGPAAALGQTVEVTDLGTLGGGYSYAVDVNAAGMVVGAADVDDTSSHAFAWTAAGRMQDLGTPGG